MQVASPSSAHSASRRSSGIALKRSKSRRSFAISFSRGVEGWPATGVRNLSAKGSKNGHLNHQNNTSRKKVAERGQYHMEHPSARSRWEGWELWKKCVEQQNSWPIQEYAKNHREQGLVVLPSLKGEGNSLTAQRAQPAKARTKQTATTMAYPRAMRRPQSWLTPWLIAS